VLAVALRMFATGRQSMPMNFGSKQATSSEAAHE